jgi:NADH:ubiquinone oxidoreductase subunit 5 (subunit L)/multisubunit Na+/H+ antiporter MnhA subunit
MKDHLHQDITTELNQTTRTDTTTVIVGVVLNLIFLLVNSLVAGAVWTEEYVHNDAFREELIVDYTIVTEFELGIMLIFIILVAAIIAINVFIIRALLAGKERRIKLTASLQRMYQEEDLGKYYNSSTIKGYEARYGLYTKIVGTLGVLAVVIPIVVLTL